jgi:hypothetical protein
MMAALVAGERNPKVLAQLARRRMRAKIGVLEEAFTGHFTDHHAFLLARMLARVDAISANLDSGSRRRSRLSRMRWPGWMRSPVPAAAHVILAETLDMTCSRPPGT